MSACGSNTGEPAGDGDENVGGASGDAGTDGGADDVSFRLAFPCADSADSLYGDPGELPAQKGAIMRCVDDGVLDQATLAARLASLSVEMTFVNSDGESEVVRNTYQGPPPQGGTHVYRVLYRTERGDGSPGYSVAAMYVPEPAGTRRMPLMLLAHGARGEAPGCAPTLTPAGEWISVDSPDGRYVQSDLEAMLYPLVASGFAVAVTDSAGFSNYGAPGNPPSGFADVQDMARSFLDSGHAMRTLLPDGTSDDVLLVGLSQGGHTVLGSLQVANDYPAPGRIIGAAVYSPLWFAQRAWGAVMNPLAESAGIILNQSSGVPASIWYHYTHAELYDGPGEGLKLFRPEVRDAVKHFVDNVCWSDRYQGLEDATREGALASDFFTEEMVAALGGPALARSCDDAADVALCEKWMERYRADHPVLTGAAAEVPLVLTYGLKDPTIPAPRFKCALDKLHQSANTIDLCIDPEANHAGVVLNQSAYVNQWLLHKATGAPITASCPSQKVPDGLACDPFLPND